MKRRSIRIWYKVSYLVVALLLTSALVDAFVLDRAFAIPLLVVSAVYAVALVIVLFLRTPRSHDLVAAHRYRQPKTVVLGRTPK